MNTFGSIIARYRKQNKYTQADLCAELHKYGYSITPGAVSTWEKDNSQPSAGQFLALCKILHITQIYNEFLGDNPDDAMSLLNAEGKQKANEFIKLLLLSEQFRRNESAIIQPVIRSIHLYDIPVSAGTGEWLEESNYEEIEVGNEVPEIADFGVRIAGDSMEPQYVNGQIVWIQQLDKIEDGEIGIFFLDGKGYIKKLQDNKKGSYLISLNKKYDPIEINENTVFRTLGKVVG